MESSPSFDLPPRNSGSEKDAAYSSSSDPASYFYTILPPIVQRRVPRIRSLRRTASIYSSGGHTKVSSHSRFPSDVSVGSTTPPPSYRTSLLNFSRNTSSATPSAASSDHEDNEDGLQSPGLGTTDDLFNSLPTSRQISRPSSSGSATPPYTVAEETDNGGIQWKFANQGYSLLSLSSQEARSNSSSLSFSRRLYIDALGYLLRGLPSELSREETLTLQAALPESLSQSTLPDDRLVAQSQSQTGTMSSRQKPGCNDSDEPSFLHRFTAQSIVFLFLAANFLLPYIQILAQSLYAYDRKHHISNRLVQKGLVAADSVGKQTVTLAKTVGAINDGLVAEKVREAGVWWFRGVAGGVYEGFGEGLEVLGLMDGAPANRRKPGGGSVLAEDEEVMTLCGKKGTLR